MSRPLDRAAREARWARIRDQLLAHAPTLGRQGYLASRRLAGGTAWGVRWTERVDGRRKDRRIYVGGDDVLVARARALLGRLRAAARASRELDRLGRLAWSVVRLVKRRAGRARRPVVRRVGRGSRPGGTNPAQPSRR